MSHQRFERKLGPAVQAGCKTLFTFPDRIQKGPVTWFSVVPTVQVETQQVFRLIRVHNPGLFLVPGNQEQTAEVNL